MADKKSAKKSKITIKDLDLTKVKGGSKKDPRGGFKLTARPMLKQLGSR